MSDTASGLNEEEKRRAVREVMVNASLSAQERHARIQQILSGNSTPLALAVDNAEDIGDYSARTGHAFPAPVSSLLMILDNDRALAILGRTLDANVDDEVWASAYDVEDNFGFDLTGPNEVIRFATQSTGSIFGLLVGTKLLTEEELETSTPVVHVDSEGSAARVAPNLKSFWRTLLSLNCFYNGVLSYIGTCSAENGELNDTQIEVNRSRVNDRIRIWRENQATGGYQVSEDDLQYLAAQLDVTIESDSEAVQEMFECDFADPRWRPPVLDEVADSDEDTSENDEDDNADI